jgi:hypothetical protein
LSPGSQSLETEFAPLNRIAAGKSIGTIGAIAEYLAESKKLARPIVMATRPIVTPSLLRFGRPIAMSAPTTNT